MGALTNLAADIRREHEHAYGKAREALEHARRAGELLIEAKSVVEHGQWLPWLAANVPFSERTAQGYMRLASRWSELEAKSATVADLPLRAALKALAEPDEGASIVRRLHDVAVDCDDDDVDEDHLHARMSALSADATSVIETTNSVQVVARIADAARDAERAAAARRVRGMRILGGIINSTASIDRAMRVHADAKAFVAGESAHGHGFTVIAESKQHPGYWDVLQIGVGEAVTLKRPIRVDALPMALASLGCFVSREFHPCEHADVVRDFFSEVAA